MPEARASSSAGPRGKNSQIRITQRDIRLYGYTDGCRRCTDLMNNAVNPYRFHSDECRLRIYLEWKEHNDPKWNAVRHIVEPDSPAADPVPVEMEAEDFAPRQSPAPSSPAPSSASHRGSGIATPGDGLTTPAHDGHWDPESFQDFAQNDPDDPSMEGFFPDADEDDYPHEPNADDWMDDRGPYDLDADGGDAMMDALVMAGTDPEAAYLYTCAVMNKKLPPTFLQIYGRGGIMKEANWPRRSLNVEGLGALDLLSLIHI